MSLNVWEHNYFKFIILMKELKKLDGVQELSKNVQKNVNGGHCPPCGPGECGQIIFPGPDWFCTPC
ncbi:hypothetical protein GCM10009430_44150 [Aquimarina litoralis]|uniref:Bacteriocin-type signal sequence-containing protein n=1 Tax=Aquimarina litoralis TaxID=584605 RepID=A0ABP3UFL9_9FLAO